MAEKKKKVARCRYNRGICNLQGAIGGFWADVGTVKKISKSRITPPFLEIYKNPPGEILTYEAVEYPPEDITFAFEKKKLFQF